MSPHKHDDNKLLFAVCGLVVAGAAALAIVAGVMADREASPAVAVNRPDPRPAIEETVPAPLPQPVAQNPESAEEPTFEIDADANLVAAGIGAYRAREFERAAAWFGAECERQPEIAWTRYMHGLALWKSGRNDDAVDAMERAAELDPGSIKTFVNLSRIQNDRGEFARAVEAADTALALQTDDAAALFLRGRSLRNLGRVDEAIDVFGASLAVDPDHGFSGNLLGLTLIEQGRFEEASRVLERAAAAEPEVAFIQNNLGMALEHVGRGVEALAAYRTASELDTSHAKAALNLARLEKSGIRPAPADLEDETVELAVAGDELTPAVDAAGPSGLLP